MVVKFMFPCKLILIIALFILEGEIRNLKYSSVLATRFVYSFNTTFCPFKLASALLNENKAGFLWLD